MKRDSKALRVAMLIVLGLFVIATIAGQDPILISKAMIVCGFFALGYFIGHLIWSLLIEPKLRK